MENVCSSQKRNLCLQQNSFSIFCCLSTLNCTSARAYEHKIEVEALRRELDGVSAAVANATKIIAEEIAISRAGVESLWLELELSRADGTSKFSAVGSREQKQSAQGQYWKWGCIGGIQEFTIQRTWWEGNNRWIFSKPRLIGERSLPSRRVLFSKVLQPLKHLGTFVVLDCNRRLCRCPLLAFTFLRCHLFFDGRQQDLSARYSSCSGQPFCCCSQIFSLRPRLSPLTNRHIIWRCVLVSNLVHLIKNLIPSCWMQPFSRCIKIISFWGRPRHILRRFFFPVSLLAISFTSSTSCNLFATSSTSPASVQSDLVPSQISLSGDKLTMWSLSLALTAVSAWVDAPASAKVNCKEDLNKVPRSILSTNFNSHSIVAWQS